jgi:PII-like signaling protein
MEKLSKEEMDRIENEATNYHNKNCIHSDIRGTIFGAYKSGATEEALRSKEEIERLKAYLTKIVEVIDKATPIQQRAALNAIKALCKESLIEAKS